MRSGIRVYTVFDTIQRRTAPSSTYQVGLLYESFLFHNQDFRFFSYRWLILHYSLDFLDPQSRSIWRRRFAEEAPW